MSLQLSIVMPIYNEAENLPSLISDINKYCSSFTYEIIAVNDGSKDNTKHVLLQLRNIYPQLRIVNLKRNYGQSAALAAGIDLSNGEQIVTIDADGQNDPADIPKLVSKINDGYDVVSGWRIHRADPWITKKFPSKIANWIISWVLNVPLKDYGCTLKIYRRPVIADIQIFGEIHRFLPAWCAWQGAKVTELEVNHRARHFGKSNYGLERTFKVLIDLMTIKFFSGFLHKPNYLFSGTGFLFLSAGVFSSLVAVYDKFGPNHWEKFRIPLLLLATLFFMVAVFLILMGLIAELLARLYFQVRQQKPYKLES